MAKLVESDETENSVLTDISSKMRQTSFDRQNLFVTVQISLI